MRALTKATAVLFLMAAAPVSAERRDGHDPHVSPSLVSGEWRYEFLGRGVIRVLDDRVGISGFAFGPGREEVAYCRPVKPGGRSGIWVVSAAACPEWTGSDTLQRDGKRCAARLLWAAPEGVKLHGPVRWAPDGSKIAVLACRDGGHDLVAVDYATGAPAWLSQGLRVLDAAWDWGTRHIAHVTQDPAGRRVWLQTMPPTRVKRLGEGGYDLRWSFDGKRLRWLRPESKTRWVEMVWHADAEQITEGNPRQARCKETVWSPNGMWCAAVENVGGKRKLVIYPARGAQGEVIELTNVTLRRVLCWFPDSRVVLVLGDDVNRPIAVGARPAAQGALSALGRSADAEPLAPRACLAAYPMNPEAGAPAWASGSNMLAYVAAGRDSLPRGRNWDIPFGSLVVADIGRDNLVRVASVKAETRRVMDNMKNIALALQMFAADNDGLLPAAEDARELRRILRAYLPTEHDFFARPGAPDEMVVEYLVEPGLRLSDVQNPGVRPIALVDYHPDFYVVAFADGHVRLFENE
jgi:prepilin-type processing-associated H-X9-DG protein